MNGSKKRVHFELRASRLSFDVSADVSTLLSNAPASFAFHLSFDRSMRSLRCDTASISRARVKKLRELGNSHRDAHDEDDDTKLVARGVSMSELVRSKDRNELTMRSARTCPPKSPPSCPKYR